MPEPTTHPSRAELRAYNLGQLPPKEAAAIENHIAECEPCCETIVGMSSDDTFVALLQEARQLPTDQTIGVDGSTANPSSSSQDIPAPLAEHPRYEIVDLIGKGGMGDVYKARHRVMRRTVALKIIKPELVRKPEAVDRFHREVTTAAQLSHPNIVTAYDAEQAGDVHFLVMEYVDGVDLSHTVKDRGRLPITEACDYIRQAAVGLQYAHERGMVHRDIKPHNLMVTADGTVKVLDFGLASLAPHASPDTDTVEARGDLTAAGAIMGTPDFISPEQAEDAHQADIRSDIYSLGTTLYFLLTGRPPFADGSIMHKLKSHAQVDAEPLESLRDDIPPGLADVVGRMIAKDPGDRYQTPAEVAEALSPYAAASPAAPSATKPATEPHPTAAQPTKVPPRRGPFVAAALAGLALALVAAAVFYVQLGKTTLRFEVSDPSVKVSFAGETIGVDTPDNKTFRIEPSTEQKFVVYQDGTEVETDSLTLRRGQKVVLTIDVVEGQIEIASNDRDVDVNRTNTTPKLAGQHEDPASDHEKIQGTWQAIYSADSGRVAPPEMLKNLRFIFTKDSLTMDVGERKAEGTYRLEPSTTPKSIDFTTDGETKLAIYELRGDTLQICLPEGRQGERPTAFESKPDSVNDVLIMLRRVDPGENLENQRNKIKGMWRVVSYEDDGRSLEYWKNIRLKIDLGVTQAIFTWYAGEKGDQELMTVYRLDPDGNAGWIDEDDEEGSRGIYELEGDTLRICKADERPTEYESKPGSTLIVLKRDTQQLSDAAAMELIPEAASITNDDFQKLSASPRPDTIDNKSLSLVLMSLHPSKQAEQNPAVLNDFRYLKGIIPKAATLAEAMWISRGKGYASFIQPEYISDCKTTSTSEVATGTVYFNADKLYAGAVEFTARLIDDAWRIEEFRLPNYGIRTVRGEDGKWSRLPLAGQQQSDRESAATQIKLPSDSASINQIAELLDAWKILPDASEESEEYAKKIMTLRIELSKQHTPNTESSRQTSARLALLAWPHLSDAIPTPMAQTLADLTKPDAAIRMSDRLAEADRPTEPVGWDVQAAHALALARAGKIEEALQENEALMKKIDANVRKGRLPELQLEFLGTTRSQKSLLKQTMLQKALILAIAGKTAESVDASTVAGRVEVDKPTKDDQSAIQAMLQVLAKAHEVPANDAQPAESDASAIRKTTAFLVEAAKSGDLEAVKAALEAGVDPDGPSNQLTALHLAVASRISDGKTVEPTPEIAKLLIEAGADVNAADYLGQTPLEWAATHASPEIVRMLIKAGANVNAESRYGTVLMAGARVEIAKLLIEAGADVNAGKLTSPLASAAKNGNAELIQLLVENGAHVNDPKDPPIHWAGKADAAKALLEAGADVNQRNKNGETALHLAKNTWSPNAESVKLLIEAGADVKAKNVTGATPLHAAVQMAKPEIAKLVIAAGADVDAKDKQGNTPLSLAHASLAWARGQQQVDNRPYEAVVKVLVDAGAKDDGRTELQQAVAAGDLQRVKELIATKVDVNETGPQRITTVHIASEKGRAEILAALIEAGAKFDQTDEQQMRPLHFAANADIARLLIAKGAKVDSPMPSPLYTATMTGKSDVVRELVRANANVQDSHCAEMLNWATFAGQPQVIRVLVEERDAKTLLNARNVYSPLHVAASGTFGGMNSPDDVTPQQRLDIAKLLIEQGADVNARWGANVNPQSGASHMIGTTPLMFASSQGDIEMVKFLIDQQADARAANTSGQTALHFAAQHGHRSVVELLLDANADVNALTREAKTPLDVTQDAAVKILLIQKDGKTASEILEDSQG